MPDLVAEVPEQRAVRLGHRDPQLLAVHVVALGEVEGDDAVVVAGEHLLVLAGEQVERQAVVRDPRRGRRSAASARTSSTISRRLAFSAIANAAMALRVGVVGPGAGQRARRAQLPRPVPRLDEPIAFGQMQIRAQLILAGVDRAAVFALRRPAR